MPCSRLARCGQGRQREQGVSSTKSTSQTDQRRTRIRRNTSGPAARSATCSTRSGSMARRKNWWTRPCCWRRNTRHRRTPYTSYLVLPASVPLVPLAGAREAGWGGPASPRASAWLAGHMAPAALDRPQGGPASVKLFLPRSVQAEDKEGLPKSAEVRPGKSGNATRAGLACEHQATVRRKTPCARRVEKRHLRRRLDVISKKTTWQQRPSPSGSVDPVGQYEQPPQPEP